jgi:hypothetical protein
MTIPSLAGSSHLRPRTAEPDTAASSACAHPPSDVLIDVENLYPGGWWCHDTAELTARLRAVVDLAPPDARVLVVCCGALAQRLLDVLLTARVDLRVVPPTPDAADRLLAHHLRALRPTAHVLLVSGDGGLTGAVSGHIAAGGRVTVAARPDHLSRRLQAAASSLHLLSAPTPTTPSTDATAVTTLRGVA